MDGRVLLLSEDFYRGDGLGQGWKWNPPFSGLGDPTSSRDAAALPVEGASVVARQSGLHYARSAHGWSRPATFPARHMRITCPGGNAAACAMQLTAGRAGQGRPRAGTSTTAAASALVAGTAYVWVYSRAGVLACGDLSRRGGWVVRGRRLFGLNPHVPWPRLS